MYVGLLCYMNSAIEPIVTYTSRDNSFSLSGSKQHQFRSSGTAPAEHYTRLRVVPQSPDIVKFNMRHADGSSLAWKRGTC